MSARQFAIFEMFYFFGPASLPVLQRVAYGPYDWTQGNAIEILCRLAADGIDRKRVVDELVARMPGMRVPCRERIRKFRAMCITFV